MRNLTVFIIALLSMVSGSFAQNYTQGNALPLFKSHEIIQLTIKTDLNKVLADVDDESEEYPAMLEYLEGNDTIRLDIQIRSRGNFRRNPENCPFPPLRLNFKKKQVVGTVFEGIDKVKLVTHCRSKQKRYQQYVVKEYLVYRAFNIVTDTSLRARLVQIKYEDPVDERNTVESYAIFIEPDEAFEERLNATRTDQKYLFPDSTSYKHMGKLAFFQYLIGNTDWAVTTQHNIRLFNILPDQPPHAIPYDFDWCGAVITHYAVPLPRFGTQSVTERIFRGQCRPLEDFQETAEFFNSKKDEIFALYDEFPLLSKKEDRFMTKYLQDFYKTINSNKLIKIEILDNCLKQPFR
jgi:hypothetical protein